MEKLLTRQDIERLFGCKKDKALELMRKMPHLNIGTAKKPVLRVRAEVASTWLHANEVKPEDQKPRKKEQQPVPFYPPPKLVSDGKHLIPRRKPSRPAQTKSPGDVAASTGAHHKTHDQYITAESGAQVQNA